MLELVAGSDQCSDDYVGQHHNKSDAGQLAHVSWQHTPVKSPSRGFLGPSWDDVIGHVGSSGMAISGGLRRRKPHNVS